MRRALKLLLVEDLESDARLILREITRSGFTCESERVETEAQLERAVRPDLDLIITDYKLPTMSADDVFRIVNERGRDVPVIVVSGYIDDTTAADLVRKGAADFLLKDRLARLGIAIESALARRQADDEKRMQYKILEESESRLSLALDTADLAVLTWQLNPERCTVDTRWAQLVGMPLSEAVENLNCWLDRVHESDRDYTRNNLEAMRHGRLNHFTLQQRIQNAVGDWLWVICKARVVRLDDSNQPLRACITFQDITAYKYGLTALERKSKMLDIIRVAQHGLLEGGPSEDGFSTLLEGILDITQSRYGFISAVRLSFADHGSQTSLAIADRDATSDYHRVSTALRLGSSMALPELDSLIRDLTNGGKPILSCATRGNGAAGNAGGTGLPFREYLALPIRKGPSIIGMLCLADPGIPYEFELTEELDPFLQTCAQLISAWADGQFPTGAEQQRTESDGHFRALAETEAVLIWTLNQDGACEYLNPACRYYIDTDEGEVGIESWLEIVVDDDRALFTQLLRGELETGGPKSRLVRAMDLEGDIHWIQIEGHPRYSAAREHLGFAFYGMDITARVEAELIREELFEALSGFFDLATDPALLVKDQSIIRSNRCAAALLAGVGESLDGRRLQEFLLTPQPDMPPTPSPLHTQCRRADGTWFPAVVTNAVVKPEGEEVSLVSIRERNAGEIPASGHAGQRGEDGHVPGGVGIQTLENLEKIFTLLSSNLENYPESQRRSLQECVDRVQMLGQLLGRAENQVGVDTGADRFILRGAGGEAK